MSQHDRHPHDVNLVPKAQRPKLMLGRAQGIPSEGVKAAAWILWLNPSTVTIARYADFCDAHDDGYAAAALLGLEFEVETEAKLYNQAQGLKGCTGAVSVTCTEDIVHADGSRKYIATATA